MKIRKKRRRFSTILDWNKNLLKKIPLCCTSDRLHFVEELHIHTSELCDDDGMISWKFAEGSEVLIASIRLSLDKSNRGDSVVNSIPIP